MMFNTDFELFYDVDVDPSDGSSTCDVSAASVTCPQAATYSMASTYATDINQWNEDFSAVYTRMIENGYSDVDLSDLS